MTDVFADAAESRLVALSASLHALAALDQAAILDRLIVQGDLDLPFPGHGDTRRRFAALEALGTFDLSLARLAEGHLDALTILDEAGHAAPAGSLGVWAAGPVDSLRATATGRGWQLDGARRWCSGAPHLKYALVRATTGSEERLFLVCLDAAGVEPVEGSWPALGMAASATLDVRFTAVALDLDAQVGPPGFYLQRPGFWFGGAGVAAVWLGGARAVARVLAERAGDDPHRLAHLGWVTARLVALETLLALDRRRDRHDGFAARPSRTPRTHPPGRSRRGRLAHSRPNRPRDGRRPALSRPRSRPTCRRPRGLHPPEPRRGRPRSARAASSSALKDES